MTVNLWTRAARAGLAATTITALAAGTTQIVIAQSAEAKYGSVTATTAVNVRSGPSQSNAIVGVLYRGNKAKQVGAPTKGFVPVTFNGKTRYVSATYVSGEQGGTAAPAPATTTTRATVYATTAVIVRTAPTTSSAKAGVLSKGQSVPRTGKLSGAWTQVTYRNATRWIYSKYLTTTSPKTQPTVSVPAAPTTIATRYATAALNIRATPTTNAKVFKEVPAGTALRITGKVTNGFAEIVDAGASRWVTARYLTATKTLNTGGSSGLDNLQPNGKGVVYYIRAHYSQIATMYGVRADPLPDHPSGHAVDVMIPNYKSNTQLGWTIANDLRAHASQLHIKYLIFHQHIWSVERNSEGWRLMADRGGDTANHMNHVHVTVY